MKPKFCRSLSGVFIMCLLIPFSTNAQDWGKIMTATARTNIRADRHIAAKLKGTLEAGQKVRADFLKNDWYAVFRLDGKDRDEAKALGYVYAPRLQTVESSALPQAIATGDIGAPVPPSAAPLPGKESIILRNITFKLASEGHEKVFIELNQPSSPELSSIEGKTPRVVVDFKNVTAVRKGLNKISVEGKLVRQIRSVLDRNGHTLRIVLDLAPSRDYVVDQIFYKAENLYVLDLSEDAKNQKSRP